MIRALIDVLFWTAMVTVGLLGLKFTVVPEAQVSPIGILCLSFVCYYLDRTTKPSITLVGINSGERDGNRTDKDAD